MARTTSTQDVVRRAAGFGAAEGFCCLADEQTAGRGRLGRTWIAPPGTALLASVLLHVREAAAPGVPFAAGLAMHEAIAAAPGVATQLKWPNDVQIGGRKVAGILVEVCGAAAARGRVALIAGAGVNLSVSSFPAGVDGVSLHTAVDPPPTARRLLESWLDRLDRRVDDLETGGLPALLTDWRRVAAGLGAPVCVSTPAGTVAGVAEDVRGDGALLVRTGEGMIAVVAGDVQVVDGLAQAPHTHQG